MQASPQIERMRRTPRPSGQPAQIRLAECAESLKQAVEALRRHGIVDPKLLGALVKNGVIDIGIRYNPALDAIKAASLSGFDVAQAKKGVRAKSHWQLAVNRRCVVTWHKPETAESVGLMGGEA